MLKSLLPIILILFFCTALCAQGKTMEKKFAAKKKVEIKVTSGDCAVKTGSTDEILIEVIFDIEPEEAFKPDFRETGNSLKIKEQWRGSSHGHVSWTITLPEKTEFEFSAASGNLEVNGLKKGFEANTASGDISIFKVSGEIECNTASGEISIEESDGEFDLSTASGDVDADNISGEIDINTASGEIEISNTTGIFNLSCASGNIKARNITIEEEGSFSTASGDVEVKLAKSTSADISLSAASGDVTLDYNGNELQGFFELSARKSRGRISAPYPFDNEYEEERHGETYLVKSFKRGSSKSVISVSTSSGRATLKK